MTNSLLSKITQFLGLNQIESEIYQYLLYEKEINISSIATKLNINRIQVYEAFDKLAEFGLITKPKGRNKNIEINDPKVILTNLKHKQIETENYVRQFQTLLPDLDQINSLSKKTIPVKIIQGKAEFEDLFLEMYETTNKELLFLGNADEFYNFLDENYIDYAIKKRVQKGVKHRVLSFQPGISLQNLAAFEKQTLREVRYLPEKFNSLGYINIFDNKIVNWNTKLARAVMIEDPIMANFYKTIFEVLWGFCE